MTLVRAKKSLGQNFLVDESVVSRIVDSVGPEQRDAVIEIGPGKGALTRRLVERSGWVVAIEVDRQLAAEVQASLTGAPNFRLTQSDILTVDWNVLIDSTLGSLKQVRSGLEEPARIRVVANLPYYISTAIIQDLVGHCRRIYDMTLMLQEEVVDRITSKPGGREYGYLSVLVQYHCAATKLFRVPPGSFAPTPRVWSAVIRLRPLEVPLVSVKDEQRFFSFVRAAFAQRRKTLLNNLRVWSERPSENQMITSALGSCGIDPKRRAETLSIPEFAALFSRLYNDGRP